MQSFLRTATVDLFLDLEVLEGVPEFLILSLPLSETRQRPVY
jgi:hypothetical protein